MAIPLPGAPRWHPVEQDPVRKNREAVQGQFFASDSIDGVADSLVREAVQNTLDAHDGASDGPPGIAFTLRTVPAAAVAPYLDGLWPHIEASNAKAGAAAARAECNVLVIEDWKTTGLTGDPNVFFEPDDRTTNNFYYFYRAEGRSSKTGANRGSWGIGKYTFPAASQIGAFFGLTCRDPNGIEGPLLMGQAILASRKVDGVHYTPDCWWSNMESVGKHGKAPTPMVGRSEAMSLFRSTFGVDRDDELGLSIVVPHIYDELDAGSVQRAVLKNYAVALVNNQIEIDLKVSADPPLSFRHKTIDTDLESLAEVAPKLAPEVSQEVALAREIANPGRRVLLEPLTAKPWKADTLDPAYRSLLAEAIDSGGPFVVEVPIEVLVKDRDEPGRPGSAMIGYLPADGTFAPSFYREGLRVSEVKGGKITGFRAMMLVDSGGVAELLGDAEGPSHVNWSDRTDRFRGKYTNGRNLLSALKRLPATVLQAARLSEDQIDRELAVDFFVAPEPKAKPGKKPGTKPGGGERDMPEGGGRTVRVRRLQGGFSLKLPEGVEAGDTLSVACAYDVRSGSPLKRWSAADFVVQNLPIEHAGIEKVQARGNELQAAIVDPEGFRFRMYGFDTARDVYVKADVESAEAER